MIGGGPMLMPMLTSARAISENPHAAANIAPASRPHHTLLEFPILNLPSFRRMQDSLPPPASVRPLDRPTFYPVYPAFYPVFHHPLFQVFPAIFQVSPLKDSIAAASPGVVALSAPIGPIRIAVAIVLAELPGIPVGIAAVSVGPPLTAVVAAFGVSNPGHPRFAASPNACSFARCSSSFELAAEEFAGSSIGVLSNDDPGSHSSNPTVCLNKKRGPSDSRPNPRNSTVSGTSDLPTDATTNHRRKRCPHPYQVQHRHTFRAGRPSSEGRQIRWVEAGKC